MSATLADLCAYSLTAGGPLFPVWCGESVGGPYGALAEAPGGLNNTCGFCHSHGVQGPSAAHSGLKENGQ